MRPVGLSVASAPSRPATAVLAGSCRASSPSDQTPQPDQTPNTPQTSSGLPHRRALRSLLGKAT